MFVGVVVVVCSKRKKKFMFHYESPTHPAIQDEAVRHKQAKGDKKRRAKKFSIVLIHTLSLSLKLISPSVRLYINGTYVVIYVDGMGAVGHKERRTVVIFNYRVSFHNIVNCC